MSVERKSFHNISSETLGFGFFAKYNAFIFGSIWIELEVELGLEDVGLKPTRKHFGPWSLLYLCFLFVNALFGH